MSKDFLVEIIGIIVNLIGFGIAYLTLKTAIDTYKSANEIALYNLFFQTKKELDNTVLAHTQSPKIDSYNFLRASIENYCNSLEIFCRYYLVGKIDKENFRNLNQKAIAEIVESKESLKIDAKIDIENDYTNLKEVHRILTENQEVNTKKI